MSLSPRARVPRRGSDLQINLALLSNGLGGTTTVERWAWRHNEWRIVLVSGLRSQCRSISSRVRRLGDDGAPYLHHVRDHASSLLELRSMAL